MSMRVRLQVVISESEMDEIRRIARREGLSVAGWVRRALREARSRQPVHATQLKLKAVREAAKYSFLLGKSIKCWVKSSGAINSDFLW